MPKGRPSRPPLPEYTLTWILQVRQRGVLVTEFKFRNEEAESIGYLPSGQVRAHGLTTIDRFIEIAKEVRDGKSE